MNKRKKERINEGTNKLMNEYILEPKKLYFYKYNRSTNRYACMYVCM